MKTIMLVVRNISKELNNLLIALICFLAIVLFSQATNGFQPSGVIGRIISLLSMSKTLVIVIPVFAVGFYTTVFFTTYTVDHPAWRFAKLAFYVLFAIVSCWASALVLPGLLPIASDVNLSLRGQQIMWAMFALVAVVGSIWTAQPPTADEWEEAKLKHL